MERHLMDTLLFGLVTVRFLVFTGTSMIVALILAALITALIEKWNAQ